MLSTRVQLEPEAKRNPREAYIFKFVPVDLWKYGYSLRLGIYGSCKCFVNALETRVATLAAKLAE